MDEDQESSLEELQIQDSDHQCSPEKQPISRLKPQRRGTNKVN